MRHCLRFAIGLALFGAAGTLPVAALAQDTAPAKPAAQATAAPAAQAKAAPAAQANAAPAAQAKPQAKEQAKQGEAEAPAPKKKDPTAAYAAGTRAFEAGKMGDAIQSLSQALATGGLPGPQMAKALYYRGVAYRKQGKPAQAISDLTTAVWLKGGLSDTDRAQAIENRQTAYREAGLGDTPPPVGAAPLDAPIASAQAQPSSKAVVASAPAQQSFWSSLFGGSPAPVTAAPPPAAAPGAPAAIETAAVAEPAASTLANPQAQPPQEAWQTAVTQQTADPPAPSPPPAQVAESAVPSPFSSATAVTASLTGDIPAAPAPAPASAFSPDPPAAALAPAPSGQPAPTQPPATLAAAGSAITGFFSNVFNTGSGSQAAVAAAPAAAPGPVAPPSTATSSSDPQWADTTLVASAESASKTDAAPLPWASRNAAAPASQPAAAAPTAGKYRLQVAAVRSRAEAERLAASLKTYQARYNSAVEPDIDEAVIGSMGTFYRVRLGPYADANEPGQLCKSLKPQGFDCLVVTQ